MTIGTIYRNECAGERNPHRIGIYIGRASVGGKKYPQFLHADGGRSCFAGPTDLLTVVGVAFRLKDLPK